MSGYHAQDHGAGSRGEPERLEAEAWRDLFDAAPASARRALGMEVLDLGGLTCFICPGIDNILFNRVLGATATGGAATAEMVAPVIDTYHARGVERFWIHTADVVSEGLAAALVGARAAGRGQPYQLGATRHRLVRREPPRRRLKPEPGARA